MALYDFPNYFCVCKKQFTGIWSNGRELEVFGLFQVYPSLGNWLAWVTLCYLRLIPLFSFHEMDDVKDSEKESLSTSRQRWRQRKREMDNCRER